MRVVNAHALTQSLGAVTTVGGRASLIEVNLAEAERQRPHNVGHGTATTSGRGDHPAFLGGKLESCESLGDGPCLTGLEDEALNSGTLIGALHSGNLGDRKVIAGNDGAGDLLAGSGEIPEGLLIKQVLHEHHLVLPGQLLEEGEKFRGGLARTLERVSSIPIDICRSTVDGESNLVAVSAFDCRLLKEVNDLAGIVGGRFVASGGACEGRLARVVLNDPGQRSVDLLAHSDGLRIVLRDWNHDVLVGQVVAITLALAIDDVENRNREALGRPKRRELPVLETGRGSGSAPDGGRGRTDGVASELAHIGGVVELPEPRIDLLLAEDVHALQSGTDDRVDDVDSLGHAETVVASLVAVPEHMRFVSPNRNAGRARLHALGTSGGHGSHLDDRSTVAVDGLDSPDRLNDGSAEILHLPEADLSLLEEQDLSIAQVIATGDVCVQEADDGAKNAPVSNDKRAWFLAVSKTLGDATAEVLAGLGGFKILVVEASGRDLSLVRAEGAFLKSIVDLNLKVHSLSDQVGGLNGTRKLRGKDPLDGQGLDDWRCLEGLLFTRCVQRGVSLALGETLDVPIGLTVADEEEVPKILGDILVCVAPVFGAVDVAVGSHFWCLSKGRNEAF